MIVASLRKCLFVSVSKNRIQELHQEACQNERDFYIDPETGYQVMTAFYHLKRGHCCESGCRHCPYGFTTKVEPEIEKKRKKE